LVGEERDYFVKDTEKKGDFPLLHALSKKRETDCRLARGGFSYVSSSSQITSTRAAGRLMLM